MSDFLPVLLGSDANVYGMARSFYQQYGVRSVAICKGALVATSNTNLVKIAVLEPDLENDETFVKTLTDYAKAHADKPLVLVSCADGYTVLMGRHRDALKPYYHFARPELQTVLDLDIKENFYRACEAHGLSYPKTATCNAQNYKNIELPFAFPVIIKASNSPAYWNCTFPHKKKVFLANNREEFDAITAAIYGSSYQDELILQEYIPGDDNCMRVLNAYVDQHHRVRMMFLGHPLLEDPSPVAAGNYAAILPDYNEGVFRRIKAFLEDIKYEGVANFDMKYDERDGEYKLFEINLRQGRSSYFVTLNGFNLAKYFVHDLVEDTPFDGNTLFGRGSKLWLEIPKSIFLDYVAEGADKETGKRMLKSGDWGTTLEYSKDMNPLRWLMIRHMFSIYKKSYAKYFTKKGELK